MEFQSFTPRYGSKVALEIGLAGEDNRTRWCRHGPGGHPLHLAPAEASADSASSFENLHPYEYRPLDQSKNEIRLVTIHPGKHDDPIEITLNHVSLNPPPPRLLPNMLGLTDLQATLPPGWSVHETFRGQVLFKGPDESTTWAHPDPRIDPATYDVTLISVQHIEDTPDYEALSYVWGSMSRPATVVVCGDSISRNDTKLSILHIGESLDEALRYVRSPDERRIMWIDFLCINQADLEERQHQVGRMAHIYSRARKREGAQIEVLSGGEVYARSPDASDSTWHDAETPLDFDDATWAALTSLVERSWFSRLWVIQEVHMGNQNSFLQCGHHEMPWLLFRHAAYCFAYRGPYFSARPLFTRLIPMVTIRPGRLFDAMLFATGSHHCCADPRDIVYGLLSLAPPELQDVLSIDYTRTTQQVYRQFFIEQTSLQHRSDLLMFVTLRPAVAAANATSQVWPSWVPDWRDPFYNMPCHIYSLASASGRSCSEMEFDAISSSSLRIKGKLLGDTVSNPLIEYMGHHSKVLKKLVTMPGIEALDGEMPNTEKPRIGTGDSYIDTVHEGVIAERLRTVPEWVPSREWLKRDVLRNRSFSMDSKEGLPSWWNSYYICCTEYWAKTKLLVTKAGRLGAWKEEFQVVGAVYLDGMMDGAAFLGPLPEPWCAQYEIVDEFANDRVYFKDMETGAVVTADPILDSIPLPQKWEPVDWTRKHADPRMCCRFRDRETGGAY
ncbi:HET-domain-containing protein [Apiospora aurea]|uniref:HET-domain-containing protein n=1 Tax=Apiospora aurea TaxID=335848 RepID=A0ABR1QG03_9PEZI